MMNRIGRERGWPPSGRARVRRAALPARGLAAGSPQEVAEKILFEHELFGHERYIGADERRRGRPPAVLRSMELFGTEVAPVVRAEVARREAQARACRVGHERVERLGSSERVAAGHVLGHARRAGSA